MRPWVDLRWLALEGGRAGAASISDNGAGSKDSMGDCSVALLWMAIALGSVKPAMDERGPDHRIAAPFGTIVNIEWDNPEVQARSPMRLTSGGRAEPMRCRSSQTAMAWSVLSGASELPAASSCGSLAAQQGTEEHWPHRRN
jgi:hypothetical protein